MSSSQKLKLLLGALVLLLILCYQMAFKKTFEARTQYTAMLKQSRLLENTPGQLASLERKAIYYDSVLHKMNMGNTPVQNNLLRIIQQQARLNEVQILDFNQPHVFSSDTNSSFTYTFHLEGPYNGLIKSLYAIEQNGSFGEIIHADFRKTRNYRTKKTKLVTKVFLRQMR